MLEDPFWLIVCSCLKPAFLLIGYTCILDIQYCPTFLTELSNAYVINQWNTLLALLLNYDF